MVYWKFTSVEAFKYILKTQKVRVSPAIDLNDPGEFKYNIGAYPKLQMLQELTIPEKYEKVRASLENYFGRQLPSSSDLNTGEKDILYEYIVHHIGVLRENTKRMPFDLSRIFGVFSCSFNKADEEKEYIKPIENPIIWAHYAQNHKGVVFSLNDDFFVKKCEFEEVIYQASAPILPPSLEKIEQLFPAIGWDFSDDFSNVVCTKHITWKYESEYRALYPLENAEYSPETDMYFADINQKSIGTVIFGCRTSERDIREIVSLAKQKLGRSLDYVKAWESPNSYSLQRIPFINASNEIEKSPAA